MSYCKTFGKDTVMFVTKEDHAIPSTVVLPPPEPAQGLITSTGEINWSCPCLGGLATGPCGVQFRDAFSCFHYSEADPKGSDCYDAFRTMQDCFLEYPTVYNKASGNDEDDGNETNIMDMGIKEDTNEHQEAAASMESKNESEETAAPQVSTEVEKSNT